MRVVGYPDKRKVGYEGYSGYWGTSGQGYPGYERGLSSAVRGCLIGDSDTRKHLLPEHIHFKGLEYTGSGCPAGTVAVSFSDGRSNVVLAFDSYVASATPKIPNIENRKNCEIKIELGHPQGLSWAESSNLTRKLLPSSRASTISWKNSSKLKCRRPGIWVNNEDNKDGLGILAVDTMSVKVTGIIGLQWGDCDYMSRQLLDLVCVSAFSSLGGGD
ncbi:hypothetical protein BDZ91DRAFT_783360 [Kalaharituber pfeilii]|nr:hypothetical protein BDZ91DRAFT_783360 [Kalaharituber pfeilii]